MSVKVNYKGSEILSLSTDITKKLTTSGEYCEDDIELVNSQDDAGGVNPLLYVSDNCKRLYEEKTLPNNFAVEFGEGVTALGENYYGCFASTEPQSSADDSELTVKCNGTITRLNYLFYSSKFKKATLDFDTSQVTIWNRTFAESKITEIVGLIDMSSATDVSSCFGNVPVKTVHFKPNTIPKSLMFRYSVSMAKSSVISLANGLDETATGQSLSNFASSYATKLATLGTVSMDEPNTYHIFTEDADGDTTLQDFITDVKGWTIA